MTNVASFIVGFIVSAILGLMTWFFTPSTVGELKSVGLAVGLVVWALVGILGLKKNEVGFNASLLIFGARTSVVFGEGWFWVGPFPFIASFKPADVRDQKRRLDPTTILSLEAGGNAVELRVGEGIIIFRIEDVPTYFNVGPDVVAQALDDLFDATLRAQARGLPMNEIVGSALFSENVEAVFRQRIEKQEERGVRWGIYIVDVAVPSILPPPEVVQALQRQRIEEAERQGEITELQHIRERLAELMALPPQGPGFSATKALEVLQTERGKVKKDIKEINVDPATIAAAAQAIAAALGRRS